MCGYIGPSDGSVFRLFAVGLFGDLVQNISEASHKTLAAVRLSFTSMSGRLSISIASGHFHMTCRYDFYVVVVQ